VDVYHAGGADVFLVRGPRGELDIPGVRGIVLDLAPERGEMIVDLDALALDARPVDDEDYVRPRDRRPRKQPRGPNEAKGPKHSLAPAVSTVSADPATASADPATVSADPAAPAGSETPAD
jgi:hypothetical protein